MYTWERRAAENLTNTQHMREMRRKLDLDYQNHLRSRERERADAEVKREILGMRTPSPPPSSQSNKFKTRTYDRPWAKGEAAAEKVSKLPPCSYGTSASSETRSSWNKGSVSWLPAICSGTQSKTTELAMTSMTPHRGKAPLASNCNKEHPAQYHNTHRSVDVKGRVLKVSTHGKANTRTQSQDTLKGETKMKHLCDRANISTRKDPVCTSTLERLSLPQPLISSSPTHSYTRLLSQRHRPPSPEDEPALQLISDSFEGFSESSSITEELQDISSEDTYRDYFSTVSFDTTISSVMESIDSECSAGSLENSLGDSAVVPLSSLLSSESEGEDADDDLSASWQDTDRESYYISVQCTGSQSSSASTSPSHSARSLQSLSSQLSTSGISGRASVSSDGYSLMPPLVQTGRPHIAPLPPVTVRVNRGFVASPQQIDQHLPELVRGPQTSWLTSQPRPVAPPRTSFSRRQFILVNRQEEADDQEGTSSNSTDDMLLSPGEISGQRTSGQMDHLTLALMLHEELVHLQEHQAEERGATAAQETQTVTDTNSETIRRVRERLLEESSDEEGDQCRICQSGASSPTNPLITPCHCSGSVQFIHHDCLKKWIQTKVLSGSELSAVKTCELCKGSLTMDLDNFDLDDYYQRHGQQQQVDDIDEELYMLLQLQQMFLDLLQGPH